MATATVQTAGCLPALLRVQGKALLPGRGGGDVQRPRAPSDPGQRPPAGPLGMASRNINIRRCGRVAYGFSDDQNWRLAGHDQNEIQPKAVRDAVFIYA
jgi:hypothetical protein